MRISINNKSTGEQLVLSFEEFKEKFRTEYERAYQAFIRHEAQKIA